MTIQKYFNYQFSENNDQDNFFVNDTNKDAYSTLINKLFHQNIFLFGPKKSGKSHLVNIWKEINDAVLYKDNFNYIINNDKNVAIDNILYKKSEEEVFHIINHCKSFNLKILATSSVELINYKFDFKDLFSRLRSFYYLKINKPDDEIFKIIMTKLFYEKQIIIKNKEIFDFILKRVTRTYNDLYLIVEKIDKLSLEKKKQLTIPLIKEIL